MKQFLRISCFLFILVALTSVTFAHKINYGLEAYNAGDYKKAYQIWLPEAVGGDALSQLYLGNMFAQGRGVAQDDKEAVRWYRLAAEQGDTKAQFNLGNMYAQGRGVAQDDKEAVRWYRLAAEQGDAEAQGNLGFMYVNGNGVMQNYVDGYAWWVVSATNGNETSRDNMERAQGKMSPAIIEKGEKLAREILERIRD
jgi:hypothetical protein